MRRYLQTLCVSAVALLPIPAFATCSPVNDATCVAGMPCDPNGLTVMDVNGTNIYACLYKDATHTSLVWETQYKQAGGGGWWRASGIRDGIIERRISCPVNVVQRMVPEKQLSRGKRNMQR